MRRIWIPALVTLVVVASVLLWRSSRVGSDGQIQGTEPVVVRFQLQWFDQGQFAGFFAAKQLGLYRGENLDVQLLEGGYQKSPISILLRGDADIAVATADQVLLAAQDSDLVALGTVFSRSLLFFMAARASGITGPRDFQGRRVAYFQGYDSENILRALLAAQRIDTASVRLEIAGATSLVRFRQGALDVYPAYIINEPLEFDSSQITLIDPEQYGVHFLSDTYITGTAYLSRHRDTLIRFLRASRRGWQFAQQHPDSAVDMMFQERGKTPTAETRQKQVAQLRTALAFLNTGATGRPFFGVDLEHWDKMRLALASIGRDASRRTSASIINTDVAAAAAAAQ